MRKDKVDIIKVIKLQRIHFEELYGYPAKKSWTSKTLNKKIVKRKIRNMEAGGRT